MAVPFIGSIVAFVVALPSAGSPSSSARASSRTCGITAVTRRKPTASAVGGGQSRAVVTAFLGAIGWAIFSWVPLVGTLLALLVWIGIINWRYPGGWKQAAIIGAVAWLSALGLLFTLNAVLGLGIGAFGVPGV